MKNTLLVACAAAFATVLVRAQTTPMSVPKAPPTVDQILSLKRVGSPQISPDGRSVAYTLRETNWDDNEYETEIWLANATNASAPRQLTNGRKSSLSPAWTPDGSRLAFVSDRTDKRQIYLINPGGGEAEALTSVEDGVNNFAWSPDGRTIAYTATEPKSAAMKEREKKFGEFEIVDQEYRMTHLFATDVATRTTRTLTSGAFTVGSFQWSPDGSSIAFDHRVNSSPASGGSADTSIVTVANASVRPLVTQEGPDSQPVWSPDGTEIAFETAMANPSFYSLQRIDCGCPGERRRACRAHVVVRREPVDLRAVPGAAGLQGPDQAHRLSRVRRHRPRSLEAEKQSGDDGTQPGVVRRAFLQGRAAAVERAEVRAA
jgi:Tol biopolymer transport system component